MRFPNLRYGDSNQFIYYASWYPKSQRVKTLSRHLRRDERTVRDWLSGRKKIPWWAPEILRLQKMEHDHMLYQMNMAPVVRNFDIVRGQVLEFGDPIARAFPKAPGIFALRLDDFDDQVKQSTG